jgi:hypothetical protein
VGKGMSESVREGGRKLGSGGGRAGVQGREHLKVVEGRGWGQCCSEAVTIVDTGPLGLGGACCRVVGVDRCLGNLWSCQ